MAGFALYVFLPAGKTVLMQGVPDEKRLFLRYYDWQGINSRRRGRHNQPVRCTEGIRN
jgi:hypothetical protein